MLAHTHPGNSARVAMRASKPAAQPWAHTHIDAVAGAGGRVQEGLLTLRQGRPGEPQPAPAAGCLGGSVSLDMLRRMERAVEIVGISFGVCPCPLGRASHLKMKKRTPAWGMKRRRGRVTSARSMMKEMKKLEEEGR